MSYWDCRKRKDCPYIYEYINTCVKDAEIVQTISSLAGYNTHFSLREDNREEYYKDCCYVTINKERNIPCYTIHKEKIEDYEGNIYCVNVPSGQLVVRDNNQIFISGNSSEPVHALCGIERINLNNEWIGSDYYCNDESEFEEMIRDYFNEDCEYDIDNMSGSSTFYITYSQYRGEDKEPLFFEGVYEISTDTFYYDDPSLGYEWNLKIKKIRNSMSYEDKGMVESLYELFGGTINSKGYKVMNPKLKAVYGDSITIPRAKEIYKRLEEKSFAANNVSLGVGSFSMECLEENGVLKPFTRDSFSIAIKATYGKRIDENGNEIEFPIFKNPKGCSGKKSLKGLCLPFYNENGELYTIEELGEEQYNKQVDSSAFINYFKDGKVTQYNFEEVRKRMEENCND